VSRSKPQPGLPTRQQILDFIASSEEPAGKREIARAFGLKGQEKIQLKSLLKDMAEEGLIDGNRTAFHRMGGVAKVTVLRVSIPTMARQLPFPTVGRPTMPPRRRACVCARRARARPSGPATACSPEPRKRPPAGLPTR